MCEADWWSDRIWLLGEAWASWRCLTTLMVDPIVASIIVPAAAILLGGVTKWLIYGNPISREHFLLGVELAFTAQAFCATSFLNILRAGIETPGGGVDFQRMVWYFTFVLISMLVVLILLGLMRSYHLSADKRRQQGLHGISMPRFLGINLLGSVALALAAAPLVG